MILFQHQVEAIEKFKQFYVAASSSSSSTSNRRRQRETQDHSPNTRYGFFIFHELGLGKTATSIRCAFEAAKVSFEENPKSTFRVAIFCPASLTEQWANEIEKSFPTKEEQEISGFVANAEIIDFGQIVKESWKNAVKRMKQDENVNSATNSMSFDEFVRTVATKRRKENVQGEEDEEGNDDDGDDDFFLPIDTLDEEGENNFCSHDLQDLEKSEPPDVEEQNQYRWKRKFQKRLKKETSKLFAQLAGDNIPSSHDSTSVMKFLICPFSRIRSFYDILRQSDPTVSMNFEIIDEVQTLCYHSNVKSNNEMKMNSTVSELLNNNNHDTKISSPCRILISGYPIQNNLGELFTMFKLAFPDIIPIQDNNSSSISKILRSRFFSSSSSSSSFAHFEKIIKNPLEKILLSSNEKTLDAQTELRAVRAMTLLCLMLRDCSHFCSGLSNSASEQNKYLPQIRTRTILCAQTVMQRKLSERIMDLCFSSPVDDEPNVIKQGQENEIDLISFESTKNENEKQMMQLFDLKEAAQQTCSSSSSSPPPLLCANWLCQIAVDPEALPSHLLNKLSTEILQTSGNANQNHQIPTKLDTAITLIHQLLSKSDQQNSERIVVFSHSVAVLELLASRLSQKFNLKPTKDFFVLSGKQTPQRRHLILSEYFSSPTQQARLQNNNNNQNRKDENDDEDGDDEDWFNFSHSWGRNRLLLASIRACGVGYNYLESATAAIMLDSRWNPAHEKQAEGRICRLTSSSFSMQQQQQQNNNFKTIFRLITKDSVDEIFEQIQNGKRKLFKTVFAAGEKFCKKVIVAAGGNDDYNDDLMTIKKHIKSLDNLLHEVGDDDADENNSNTSDLKDCLASLKNNDKKAMTLVMQKASHDVNINNNSPQDFVAKRKLVEESIVSWLFEDENKDKADHERGDGDDHLVAKKSGNKNAARNGNQSGVRKDPKPQFSRFAPCAPQQWMTCRGSGMSLKLDHKK